jgi:hypothetical protein
MHRRFIDWVFDAAAWLAAAFVFAIFAVMIGGSAMRMLGLPTGGLRRHRRLVLRSGRLPRNGAHVSPRRLRARRAAARAPRPRAAAAPSRSSTLGIAAVFVAYLLWAPRNSSTRAGSSTTWRTA